MKRMQYSVWSEHVKSQVGGPNLPYKKINIERDLKDDNRNFSAFVKQMLHLQICLSYFAIF